MSKAIELEKGKKSDKKLKQKMLFTKKLRNSGPVSALGKKSGKKRSSKR